MTQHHSYHSSALLPFMVNTFYKFVDLPDAQAWREPIKQAMLKRDVTGTIILAPEGINATVTGKDEAVLGLLDELKNHTPIGELTGKISRAEYKPFLRSIVKLKPELISLGVYANPTACVGEYVKPADWNALISREDVITIDTRNDYEFRIGRFKGALNPNTSDFKETVTFTEQHVDPAVHKHVAMYCTGGIRCEKYSSYLIDYGVQSVYHLQGGVLQYLQDVPESETMWEGVCYVFDDRVAVNHDLSDAAHITQCYVCGRPLEPHDRLDERYIPNTQCRFCFDD